MMNNELNLLFPIPVMVGKLDRDFTEEELSVIQEHKNHLMANYGNKSTTNAYILDILELKALGQRAKMRAKAEFSPEKLINSHLSLFDEILSR